MWSEQGGKETDSKEGEEEKKRNNNKRDKQVERGKVKGWRKEEVEQEV